ncbi:MULTISPECIES: ABC transporter ATP-binding protein [unclassified Leucobacter]|uniref:ABC transporter ATP-binding protein n=1 Tax=unclassified Leucobacter TaxID=2621730 RepID=UPI00165E6012|nr:MULTISPECIES: ABC transporter ATP-binding protein [unclassified Leucobacter]MBC9926441.1 ABC transporter ATP-binding protein [Leucobacter sp. cx-169]
MSLKIDNVEFSYPKHKVLKGVSLEVAEGSFCALLGPNGSGKSTLTKILAGIQKPSEGRVSFDGVDLLGLRRRDHARTVGYVPQSGEAPFDMTVREAVLLGRTPHFGLRPSRKDWNKVEDAIDLLGLGELEHRRLSELSGGQAQRALVARAIAQDTKLLLLDEPTSALDLRYQVETLQLVRWITRRRGITALIAIHDLNHAGRFCDQTVLLNGGKIVASGSPVDAFDEETLSEVYGLRVTVEKRDGYAEVRPVVQEIEYQI